MTHADLESYKAIVRPAIKGTYHNRTIYTTHAPSAGPVLIHLLNVLEKYNFPKGERDGLSTHRFIEALKCEHSTNLHRTSFYSIADWHLLWLQSLLLGEQALEIPLSRQIKTSA